MVYYSHYDTYDMIDLYYIDQDNKQSIPLSLTPDHLLYVGQIDEQYMKRADQVKIGDKVFIISNISNINDMKFIEKDIINIGQSTHKNAYSPITMNGSLIVSNVLSSSYTKSVTNAQSLHKSAAIFRAISKIDTNMAAILTNFFYNIIFKVIRYCKMESVFKYSFTAPFIMLTVFIMIFESFRHFVLIL